jgi:hypothetical protein
LVSCKEKENYNEELLKELEKLNYINDSVYKHSFIDSLNDSDSLLKQDTLMQIPDSVLYKETK